MLKNGPLWKQHVKGISLCTKKPLIRRITGSKNLDSIGRISQRDKEWENKRGSCGSSAEGTVIGISLLLLMSFSCLFVVLFCLQFFFVSLIDLKEVELTKY